jgi:hypothetical protein
MAAAARRPGQAGSLLSEDEHGSTTGQQAAREEPITSKTDSQAAASGREAAAGAHARKTVVGSASQASRPGVSSPG